MQSFVEYNLTLQKNMNSFTLTNYIFANYIFAPGKSQS